MGLATKEILPRHVAYLKDRNLLDVDHLPNLYRYPLPTLSNAVAQLVIADPMKASVIQCGIWFLLCIPVFFLLARGLTNPFLGAVVHGGLCDASRDFGRAGIMG